MRVASIWIVVLLAVTAAAQQQQQPAAHGVIYGTVVGQDGRPAQDIGLTAEPFGTGQGFVVGGVLPHTETNDAGEYRLENLFWWGWYTVYADDERAGYSTVSTGPASRQHPVPKVEITSEHPKAKLNLRLPPRAGFLHIHLIAKKPVAVIRDLKVTVTLADHPNSVLFSESCIPDQVILVPPNTDLLLHITSSGFREWAESRGHGKPLNIPSGAELTLTVELEPSD